MCWALEAPATLKQQQIGSSRHSQRMLAFVHALVPALVRLLSVRKQLLVQVQAWLPCPELVLR